MTRPDGFWNDKTNTQYRGPADSRWSADESHKYFTPSQTEWEWVEPPASYRWMDWLMVAALLVFAASVTWCVAYGNGLPG